jgi:protein-S-isoprenylcysteine O-methyltransferase Ste14
MRAAVAWAGGVLFVLSLGSFVYFYLIVLAEPIDAASGGVAGAMAIDLALFTAFALHHSVLARAAVKQRLARLLPAPIERSVYVWTASLLFLAVCLLWRRVPGTVYDITGTPALIFLTGQAAGVLLIMRAAAALDMLELAGIRQAQSPQSAASSGSIETSILTETGVYGIVRHPIYLGWLLLTWCVPRLTVDRLLFAAVSAAYILIAIPFEERSLMGVHGAPYRRYARRVRWRVLPGLY